MCSTARVLSSSSREPVRTYVFQGWMFDPDGDQAAAESTRSSTSLGTGSFLNPRTARRLFTASYTSIIASHRSSFAQTHLVCLTSYYVPSTALDAWGNLNGSSFTRWVCATGGDDTVKKSCSGKTAEKM